MKQKLLNALLIVILLAGLLPASVFAAGPRTELIRYNLLDFIATASGAASLVDSSLTCAETAYGGINCTGGFSVQSTSNSAGYGHGLLSFNREDLAQIGTIYYQYTVSHDNTGTGPPATNSDYAGMDLADGTYSGTVTTTDTEIALSIYEGFSKFADFNVGIDGNTTSISLNFTISPVPIPDECDIPDSPPFATAVIDPTLEDPIVEHEQLEPVTIGTNYVVEIAGGPWDDSVSAVRYDTAFSWDGVTWLAIADFVVEEYVICYEYGDEQQELMTILFTAQSETLYIRVNDTAEDFADNAEVNPLIYYLALGVESCENQFVEGDLVATITVPADDDMVPVLTDGDGGTSLPVSPIESGEWYIVKVVSGSWQDDGAAPDRYDVDLGWAPLTDDDVIDLTLLDRADITWDDLSTAQGTYCNTTDGTYETAYVQAVNNLMFLAVSDDAETFEANTGEMTVEIYEATFTEKLTGCALGWRTYDIVMSAGVAATNPNGQELFETDATGNTVSLLPGRSYMLETLDGPWQLSDVEAEPQGSFDLAISDDGGVTWYDLKTWADASCIMTYDGVGHLKVFFTVPNTGTPAAPDGPDYKVRVYDSAFTDNQYGMSWNLYRAYELSDLEDGSCDYTYDLLSDLQDEDIAANNSAGLLLDLVIETIPQDGPYYDGYAIVITGGPWSEQVGGADEYDMEINFGSGFENYLTTTDPHVLCREQDGNDVTLYVSGDGVNAYYLRMASTSFSNNIGTRHVTVYPMYAGDQTNTWSGCLDNYEHARPMGRVLIPEKLEDGVMIAFPTDANGNDVYVPTGDVFYAITTSGEWMDDTVAKYDTAISNDNGTTWEALSDLTVECYDKSTLGYEEIVFSRAPGEYWRIRVNDETGDFADNSGAMYYTIWLLYDDVDESGETTTDPQYGSCTQACVRPTLTSSYVDAYECTISEWPTGLQDCLLNLVEPVIAIASSTIPDLGIYLANWLGYLGCSVMQFFSWCPRHETMLSGVTSAYGEREPFKSVREVKVMAETVKREINSQHWEGCVDGNGNLISCGTNYSSEEICSDQNGNRVPCSPTCFDSNGNQVACSQVGYTTINQPTTIARNDIEELYDIPRDSPWRDGDLIDFWATPQYTTAYYLSCSSELASMVNAQISGGICFISNHFRESGASMWIQIFVDVSCVVLLVSYVFRLFGRLVEYLSG